MGIHVTNWGKFLGKYQSAKNLIKDNIDKIEKDFNRKCDDAVQKTQKNYEDKFDNFLKE